MTTSHTAPAPFGALPLGEWGLIRAQGADARAFLQGQLTQDVVLMGAGEARLAGYCSAKGRMLASFVAFAFGPDDIGLLMPAALLEATLKRLRMFVMRAQVVLSDASADWAFWGLAWPTPGAGADLAGYSAVGLPAPGAHSTSGAGHWIGLPAAEGQVRCLWLGPVGERPPLPEGCGDLSPAHWDWLAVRSGVAHLVTETSDAFVPQMLNYESVGGVNFKKGCYPGQEVVARSQFRGTLKRRTFLLHSESALHSGQPVFHSGDAEQPCGTVLSAAPHPSAGWDALVSMQVSAAESGSLHAGAADGPVLQLLALPYPLLSDI